MKSEEKFVPAWTSQPSCFFSKQLAEAAERQTIWPGPEAPEAAAPAKLCWKSQAKSGFQSLLAWGLCEYCFHLLSYPTEYIQRAIVFLEIWSQRYVIAWKPQLAGISFTSVDSSLQNKRSLALLVLQVPYSVLSLIAFKSPQSYRIVTDIRWLRTTSARKEGECFNKLSKGGTDKNWDRLSYLKSLPKMAGSKHNPSAPCLKNKVLSWARQWQSLTLLWMKFPPWRTQHKKRFEEKWSCVKLLEPSMSTENDPILRKWHPPRTSMDCDQKANLELSQQPICTPSMLLQASCDSQRARRSRVLSMIEARLSQK